MHISEDFALNGFHGGIKKLLLYDCVVLISPQTPIALIGKTYKPQIEDPHLNRTQQNQNLSPPRPNAWE